MWQARSQSSMRSLEHSPRHVIWMHVANTVICLCIILLAKNLLLAFFFRVLSIFQSCADIMRMPQPTWRYLISMVDFEGVCWPAALAEPSPFTLMLPSCVLECNNVHVQNNKRKIKIQPLQEANKIQLILKKLKDYRTAKCKTILLKQIILYKTSKNH